MAVSVAAGNESAASWKRGLLDAVEVEIDPFSGVHTEVFFMEHYDRAAIQIEMAWDEGSEPVKVTLQGRANAAASFKDITKAVYGKDEFILTTLSEATTSLLLNDDRLNLGGFPEVQITFECDPGDTVDPSLWITRKSR